VPLKIKFRKHFKPKQLRALMPSICAASVTLPDSTRLLSTSPTTLAHALAGSASTLTALHGLPMPQPSDRPQLGLTAFTRLRTLTLVHTLGSQQVVAAELLPLSLRELTLRCTCLEAAPDMQPPLLCSFSRLTNLQRLTLVEYDEWLLGSRDAGADRPGRLRLPLSLQVWT